MGQSSTHVPELPATPHPRVVCLGILAKTNGASVECRADVTDSLIAEHRALNPSEEVLIGDSKGPAITCGRRGQGLAA
jgi:hypothetical protein